MLFVVFIAGYTIFNLSHWRDQGRIIAWDVISYYGYLPAAFIYGDATLQKPGEGFEKVKHLIWYTETAEGHKVFKTSMGMAMLYAPFFAIAHLWANITEEDPSGYSPPYKFAICMSSLFALLIGLIFLRKVLRGFFSANVTALTILLIALGTNLYFYTVLGVGMPHLYLFCLLSVELYLLLKWYDNPTYAVSLGIGLIGGLMVLIRPTMIIVILLAILIKVNDLDSLKSRLMFFVKNPKPVLVIIVAGFIVWIPQFLYWKAASGSYLFYSYTDEGFFFTDPQLLNALIGFRKGWLIYTPIMLFGLIGIGLMARTRHSLALSLLVPVALYFYIATCWWDWWYGGSFGYRAMIDLYPLMAIGLAYSLQYLFKLKVVIKRIGIAVLSLMLVLSLFQTRQAHEGLMHHDSMTAKAYLAIFGKLKPTITSKEIAPLLDPPNYEAAKKGFRDQ